MIMRRLTLILLVTILAACDSIGPQPPTLTPTYAVSGPTLAPSPTVLNVLPTQRPENFVAPGQTIPEAAAVPFGGQIRPLQLTPSAQEVERGLVPVQITLADGAVVTADFYENLPIELEQGLIQPRLPAVMLVGTPKDAWGLLPAQIRQAGYTVLVVDIGIAATGENLDLALLAFSEMTSVNAGLMAVIGLEEAADLTLIACATELLCDTVVLVSPRSSDTLSDTMVEFNPRPLMVVASQGDSEAFSTAQALRDAAIGNFSLQEFEGDAGGLALLQDYQSDLATIIIEWLSLTLTF